MITDKQLTEMCHTIFGNIVVKAYFINQQYEFINPALNHTHKPDVTIKGNELDYSGETFYVEFINGATVVFTNSEWASLERINKDADLQQT